MIKDQIVTVLIKKVTDHVIHVSCEGKDGVIQITELSWNLGETNPRDYVKEGNLVEARVLMVTDKSFSASIKRLNQNSDPWLKAPTIGNVAIATVYSIVDYGYLLNVKNNIQGILLEENSISKHSVGDEVLIEITDVNNDKRNLHGREIEKKL